MHLIGTVQVVLTMLRVHTEQFWQWPHPVGRVQLLSVQFVVLLVKQAGLMVEIGCEWPDRYVALHGLLIIIEQHRV